MKWVITPLLDKQTILINTEGVVNETSLYALLSEALETALKHNYSRCLIDLSRINGTRLGVSSIYDCASKISGLTPHRRTRIANIIPGPFFEEFKFFETVCINRGLQVSTFVHKEPGIQWLTQGELPPTDPKKR